FQFVGLQDVVVRRRLEQRLQHGEAVADAEEGADAVGRQVEQFADAVVAAVGLGEGGAEAGERLGAVAGGGEDDGAGGSGPAAPGLGRGLGRRGVRRGGQAGGGGCVPLLWGGEARDTA